LLRPFYEPKEAIMAEKVTFNVLRRHEGDKLYEEGDTREAVPGEVTHLVNSGVLEKAAAKPANKAEPVVANKKARS
jgi:hypothetical protein